jgi:hypothetical protein
VIEGKSVAVVVPAYEEEQLQRIAVIVRGMR